LATRTCVISIFWGTIGRQDRFCSLADRAQLFFLPMQPTARKFAES
jgi:hypothetical protein